MSKEGETKELPEVQISASGIFKEPVNKFESGLLTGPGKGIEIADGTAISSNALEFEDDFKGLYGDTGDNASRVVIQPPYNPLVLEKLINHNNTLGPCVEAMRVNIDGTGFEIIKKEEVGAVEEEEEGEKPKTDKDLKILKDFFAEPWPGVSFTTLRKDLRQDLETIGYGFLEVVRSPKGEIVFLRHVAAKTMRLIKLDEGKIVTREITRGGTQRKMSIKLRFRRFAQKVGTSVVYFKEFQADPDLDKKTGLWAPKGEKLGFQKKASELIYFVLNKDINTPYGVPRWIAQTPSILGSRQAEENNLSFFNSGGIPPFILIVQGGILAQETKEALESGLIQNSSSKQRGMVIEAHASSGSIDDKSNVKVQVERFGAEKQKDSQFETYDDKCEVRVRGSFRLPPIFVGKCHSEDTEYMTAVGWKKYNEVTDTDRLGTYNVETKEITYDLPLSKHEYEYDGCMVHIKNRGLDALVTPNHQMLVSKFKKDSPFFIDAGSLGSITNTNNGTIDIPVTGAWAGEEVESFLIPDNTRKNKWYPGHITKNRSRDEKRYKSYLENNMQYDVSMDSFLKFLGYYISEGSITKTRGPIVISQNIGETADKIIQCLEDMQFKVSIVRSRGNELNIGICHGGLYDWLLENCGKGCSNKKIPNFIFSLSKRQIGVIYSALLEGDGHKTPYYDSWTYTTASKRLAGGFQQLATLLGKRSCCSLLKKGNPKWKDLYVVSITDNVRYTLHKERNVRSQYYKGKVSCFTMPMGTLITRRNGKILISGNSADYNFACYDSKTETLTDQGWIHYDEYKEGMKIACYNSETESLEYHEPEGGAPLVYDVENVNMYQFKTQSMDIMVTPNHTMLYKTQYRKTKTSSVEEMVSSYSRVSFIAKIKNNDTGYVMRDFTPPMNPYPVRTCENKEPITLPADIFLKFMGWFLSEGHSLKQGAALNLYQYEDRHWNEIDSLITDMESFGYNIWRYNRKDPVKVVTVHDRNLYEWVTSNCGGIGHRKRIPSCIKNLNREQLAIFFETLMKGDGSVDPREDRSSFSYSTTSEQLADDVQEVAIKLGYKAYIRKGPPGTKGVRPVYIVGMSVKGRAHGTGETYTCIFKDSMTRKTYTGKVYCFSVPTGVFVTRRNGKVALQGNSAFVSYMIGEAQIFKPERDEFDEIITLRLIPEILGKENDKYVFRSLPLVVHDVKEKIMAVKTAADKKALSIAEIVRVLNEVTGLEMNVIKESEMEPEPTLDDDNEGITSDSELTDASTSDPNGPQGSSDAKKSWLRKLINKD